MKGIRRLPRGMGMLDNNGQARVPRRPPHTWVPCNTNRRPIGVVTSPPPRGRGGGDTSRFDLGGETGWRYALSVGALPVRARTGRGGRPALRRRVLRLWVLR